MSVDVVALSKHVALSDRQKTQVVKYHGDLRYDSTLVLTESSYYRRLDFESPMDLKFRSDLLGRSVLFMGYSFRDINIRVIWFKLMEMMKDVPMADRPSSYIVRFGPNPVLETLYDAVGIHTIVLDPDGKASTDEDRSKLFDAFMLDLSSSVALVRHSTGQVSRGFVSKGLIDATAAAAADYAALRTRRRLPPSPSLRYFPELDTLAARELPTQLHAEMKALMLQLARELDNLHVVRLSNLVVSKLPSVGYCQGAALLLMNALCHEAARKIVQEADIKWAQVWSKSITQVDADRFVRNLVNEVRGHLRQEIWSIDHSIAFAFDIVYRIVSGDLGGKASDETVATGKQLLDSVVELYPAAGLHVPSTSGFPGVDAILAQIDSARARLEKPDDDIPF